MKLFVAGLTLLQLLWQTLEVEDTPTPVTSGDISNVTQISGANINSTMLSNEVVFLNFYADWCHFSKRLVPIFEHAATQLKLEFPEPGKVQLGRVDCVKEVALADLYDIQKFPTLRLFYRGQPVRREYRGLRTSEALVKFVKSQLRSAIIEFKNADDLVVIDPKRRAIIAYILDTEDPAYAIFQMMADRFKNDCDFYLRLGDDLVDLEHRPFPEQLPALVFRPDIARTHGHDESYAGNPSDPSQLEPWILEKCVPLVREVNFANVEELIEERLPLLLLFHLPEDGASIKDFKAIVEMQLADQRSKFNFVTVDGWKFEHSVKHMGLTAKDLPLIAIDSLKFMYPFTKFSDMYIPGRLKQFMQDFSTNRIPLNLKMIEEKTKDSKNANAPSMPVSTFKELGPSKHRYSLLHDEL
ncbi:endoplasmic reticulum resident protein 44-like [Drosophila obscura]|uniref:endoplasmic reticulum resident protein 44-like n=1 Tax=Drosophila obscura TaxID=7282 RepID=UPI001BB16DC2|nr:endoplasmic reticulum resident protein 44-like [Drosophila obscura]